MFEKFLNLIFPNVCGFCKKIDKNSLCKSCELNISKYELHGITNYKKDKLKYFDYLFCAFKYEGLIRQKLLSYKFGEEAYLYKTFSKILINNKKIYGFMKLYDIIIPVPMFKTKESVRGYNQSALIAKELAKDLEINFSKKTLVKTVNTKVQSKLTKNKRVLNVKGAFKVKNTEITKNKRVILVDDIYTTGSTVNECSKILKQAGAKEILVITIAKD